MTMEQPSPLRSTSNISHHGQHTGSGHGRPRAPSLPTTTWRSTPTPGVRRAGSKSRPRRLSEEDSDESGGEPKRRRVPRACDICRRRKIRCDGPLAGNGTGETECTHCRENQFKCTYVDEPARKGPPRGYITALQERCSRLENLVHQLQPGLDIIAFVGPTFGLDGFDIDAHQASLRLRNIPLFPSFKRLLPPGAGAPPTSMTLASASASSAPTAAGRTVGWLPGSLGGVGGAGTTAPPYMMGPVSGMGPLELVGGMTTSAPPPPTPLTAAYSGTAGMVPIPTTPLAPVASSAQAAGVERDYYAGGVVSGGFGCIKAEQQSSFVVPPSPSKAAASSARSDLGDTPQFYGKAATHNLLNAFTNVGDGGVARGLDNVKRSRIWTMPDWEAVLCTEGRQPIDYSVWPEDDQAAILIDSYFSCVNAVYPLLHGPLFRRQYMQRLYMADAEFAKVCLMVFANGARFVANGSARFAQWRGSSDRFSVGWKYLRTVMRAGSSLRTTPTLFSLQATALVGFFLRGNANPSTIWAVAGGALRMAQELGIHIDSGAGNTLADQQERQLLSHAFWCLYHLDRSMCVILGRAVALPDAEISTSLPLAVDDEFWDTDLEQPQGHPSVVTSFVQSLALDRIVSTALVTLPAGGDSKRLPSTIIQLAAALNQWLTNLPAELQWDTNAPDMVRISHLHARYHWARIYVHYSCVGAGEWMSSASFNVSLESARAIFGICATLLNQPVHCHGCPIGMEFIDYAWLAAMITLVGINTGALPANEHEQAMAGVNTCIATLQQMESVSRKSGQIADLLGVVARNVASQAQSALMQVKAYAPPPLVPAPMTRQSSALGSMQPRLSIQTSGLSRSASACGSVDVSPLAPTPVSHISADTFVTPDNSTFPFVISPAGSDLSPTLYYEVANMSPVVDSDAMTPIVPSPETFYGASALHYGPPPPQQHHYYDQAYHHHQLHPYTQPRVQAGMPGVPMGGPSPLVRPGDERWMSMPPQQHQGPPLSAPIPGYIAGPLDPGAVQQHQQQQQPQHQSQVQQQQQQQQAVSVRDPHGGDAYMAPPPATSFPR